MTDDKNIPYITMELEDGEENTPSSASDSLENQVDFSILDEEGRELSTVEEPSSDTEPSDREPPRRSTPAGIPGAVSHGGPSGFPSPPPPLPRKIESDGPGSRSLDLIPPPRAENHPPFVLTLDDSHVLFRSGQGEAVSSYAGCTEFLHVFTDFSDAPCGLMEFQGTVKFADVLARKKLQEKGELTPDMDVLTYSTRKGEGHMVKLAYQCPARRELEALQSRSNAHEHGAVVFDPLSIGLCCLQHCAQTSTSACIVRTPRFLLLVAGRGANIVMVRRFTMLEGRNEAIRETLRSVERDLGFHEQTAGEPIGTVAWIDYLVKEEDSALPSTSLQLSRVETNLLLADGKRYVSSLPGIIPRLSLSMATLHGQEAYLRPLERLEPVLWILLLCLALTFGVISFGTYRQHDALEQEIASIESRINELQSTMPELEGDPASEARPYIDLAANLLLAAESPSIGELWNRISQVRPQPVLLDQVVFSHDALGVQVELGGRIAADLSRSQTAFRAFLQGLGEQGFTISNQQVALAPEGNSFSMTMSMPGPPELAAMQERLDALAAEAVDPNLDQEEEE